MEPPIAKRLPTERRLHGETVVDDYAWMKDRGDPDMLSYLEEENAYTQAMTDHLAALREEIFVEIKERTQETDLAVPAKRGDYWYSTRTEEGRPYGIWVRMAGGPDGAETVLLDENEAAEGHDYFRLANFSVSPDAGIVGYSVDTDGGERYTTRFRVAVTGEMLDDEIPGTYYGAAWASDSLHYFYTVTDAAMRPWQVWRHRLGTAAADDTLVYQEDDDRYYLTVRRSRSGGFIFIDIGSAVTGEVRFISAADPEAEPDGYVVQPEWCEMLEGAVAAGRGTHWFSWLHLGVMRYHAGARDAARRAWEASLERVETPWALRNLAVLAREDGRLHSHAAFTLQRANLREIPIFV